MVFPYGIFSSGGKDDMYRERTSSGISVTDSLRNTVRLSETYYNTSAPDPYRTESYSVLAVPDGSPSSNYISAFVFSEFVNSDV